MKHMDNELSEQEHLKLAVHLEACAACSEDFSAYSEMLDEFEIANHLLAAPEGFEQAVMTQIATLAPEQKKSRNETVLAAAIGALSACLGLLVIFGHVPQMERLFYELPLILDGLTDAIAQYGLVMFLVVAAGILLQGMLRKRRLAKK